MKQTDGEARERLIRRMKLLREEVGNPSLGSIVKRSGRTLSKSTLDDHLAGRRSQLPSWRLISAYVGACMAYAEETGIDTARIETLDDWHSAWLSALRREDPLGATYTVSFDELQELAARREQPSAEPAQLPEVSLDGMSFREYTGEITAIMMRLEEDLSRLGSSFPSHVGIVVVLGGPRVGTRFLVEKDQVTIGRHRSADILLDHVTVSRMHAEIHRSGDAFSIHDLDSSNGTFLRQERIRNEAELNSYDELQIGAFKLLFVQGGAARRGRPRTPWPEQPDRRAR